MVVIPLQRSILKIREEVTERDIDPADIPFGNPTQLYRHHHNNHNGKHLSNGGSLSGSSYTSSSHSNKTYSDSESDSCFSEEEDDGEDDALHGREYPVHYRHYSESVTLTERPAYQRRHYGMEWVLQDRRRFREEVQIKLGAKPTTMFSTTTQCFINSKFRWYRDAVYIMPGAASSAAAPKRFTTTVFIFPKFPRQNVVSSLEHHTAKTIKWYKVSMELEARDFVSIKLVNLS
ncbi:uncharacterized protein [Asterias amurensis]|uniref:uncharacterized protein isoform X1 n=1 Tax=Asterias amurensis TaxID=7602 RepID=UPI003AB21679